MGLLVLKGNSVKKFLVILLAVFLAACGDKSADDKHKQVVNDNETISACAEPIGLSSEELITRLDSSLKAAKLSSELMDKQVKKNECGFAITMTTHYGLININADNNLNVLSLGTGFERVQDITDNFKKMLATIQIATSPVTTELVGKSDIGKELMSATAETIEESKKTGSAQHDFEYNGLIYSIVSEQNSVVILTRKNF